jgi:hypothetical protein
MKMKILFLDIDGVCNCEGTRQRHRGFIGIDPYMAFLVGKLTLAVPDLKVVLSSSWRHFPGGREEVEKQVVPIFDQTPISPNGEKRGDEIKMWLDLHPEVVKYAILDDDTDMLEEQFPNFFRTQWKTGITPEDVEKIIKHFND